MIVAPEGRRLRGQSTWKAVSIFFITWQRKIRGAHFLLRKRIFVPVPASLSLTVSPCPDAISSQFYILFLPPVSRARSRFIVIACMAHLRTINIYIISYARNSVRASAINCAHPNERKRGAASRGGEEEKRYEGGDRGQHNVRFLVERCSFCRK